MDTSLQAKGKANYFSFFEDAQFTEYIHEQNQIKSRTALFKKKIQLPNKNLWKSHDIISQQNLKTMENQAKATSYCFYQYQEKNSDLKLDKPNSLCSQSPNTILEQQINKTPDKAPIKEPPKKEKEVDSIHFSQINQKNIAQKSSVTNQKKSNHIFFILQLLSLFIAQCFLIRYIIATRTDQASVQK